MSFKSLQVISKNLINELKSSSPNLSKLAAQFEEINQNIKVAPWGRENFERDIFTNYSLSLAFHDYQINDFIMISYWVVKFNYFLTNPVLLKLDKLVSYFEAHITSKNWFRLLNIYSNLNNQETSNLSFDIVKNKLLELTPSDSAESIQAALDLCKLKIYDPKIWRNIILLNLTGDYHLLHDLRIIKYALECEGTNIKAIKPGEIIEKCIRNILSQSKDTDSLSKDVKNNFFSPNTSKLHREVDFVLRDLLSYTKYYVCKETFLIDFYNEELNFGLDLYGPSDYFFVDYGEKIQFLWNLRMTGMASMKKRLLTESGYKVECIPYYEWDRYSDNIEKSIYLKRKLRSIQNFYK
jgi:RAP domain